MRPFIPFKDVSRPLSESVCLTQKNYVSELGTIGLHRRSTYGAYAANPRFQRIHGLSGSLFTSEICNELHQIEIDNGISVGSSGINSGNSKYINDNDINDSNDSTSIDSNSNARIHAGIDYSGNSATSSTTQKRSTAKVRNDLNVVFLENLKKPVKSLFVLSPELKAELQAADVIMLTGVDAGMVRSGNANLAREMALELRKNYLQAIEFVELRDGRDGRQGRKEEELHHANKDGKKAHYSQNQLYNAKGYSCHAIISDFPLKNSQIVRLGSTEEFLFSNPFRTAASESIQVGSRIVLLSQVDVGGGGEGVWIAVTHLDGIKDELDAIDAGVKAVREGSGGGQGPGHGPGHDLSGPMIYGDMELLGGDSGAMMPKVLQDVQKKFDSVGIEFSSGIGARGLKISEMRRIRGSGDPGGVGFRVSLVDGRVDSVDKKMAEGKT